MPSVSIPAALGFGAADAAGAAGLAGAGIADAGAAAAGAGLASAAPLAAGVADLGVLPEVTVSALAPTAGGLAAGDLAAGGALAGAGGLAAADAAGAGTGLPSIDTAGLLSGVQGLAPSSPGVSSAQGLSAPGTGSATPTIAATPAMPGAPAAVAPPSEITNAIQGASGLPTSSSTLGGVPNTATGPVAGSSPTNTSLGDWSPRPPTAGGSASDAGLLGGATKWLKDNSSLLGLGLGGLGLLRNLLTGTGGTGIINTPQAKQAEGLASNLTATSEALQSDSLTGMLPPGYQSAIDQAKSAAVARIKAAYNAVGNSGSTSEAEDLAASDAQIEAVKAQLLTQLTSQGIQAGSTAGGLDTNLVQLQLQNDQDFNNALGNFASSLLLSSVPARSYSTTSAS